jgi:glycolate oxidase iron-sulfur subunit
VNTSSNLLQQLDYSVLQQCIHCGLCLPTCPTYDATKHETSSPRGRIALMRAVADGKLPAKSRQFADEMYFCLGCLACETACPAAVNYATMLETARAEVGLRGGWLLRWLFARPSRLRAVARLLRLDQRLGLTRRLRPLMSAQVRELHALQPTISARFSFQQIQELEKPISLFLGTIVPGKSEIHRRRFRVGLLTGCVQDVAFAEVNRGTVDVLLANGCEVITPRTQVCCGSLPAHHGELELARQLVRQNLEAFDLNKLDAIIVNSAGCGSFMKHAPEYAGKVKDICEFLCEIGLLPVERRAPSRLPLKRDGHDPASAGWPSKIRVTYHDACHLVHGQKISRQPRELLRAIPGLELVELPEATWCCGSAGLYNILRPAMSLALLERKMQNIAATGAQIVATGNPGCLNQLRYGANKFGVPVEVVHPVTLLARAYR